MPSQRADAGRDAPAQHGSDRSATRETGQPTDGQSGSAGTGSARRRQVLARLGGTVGAGGLLGGAATRTGARLFDGVVPLEVDEKDMPIDKARIWPVNATNRAVDVYVNDDDSPLISDVKPLSIGSLFTLDGSVSLPFGTYTFSIRDKGEPDDEILASASVDVTEGDSFSAVFYRVGDADYELAIYRNDYSPSEEARVVVRNNTAHDEVGWQLYQNGETPRIPDDVRSGSLGAGEWQMAADVTESDYRFEVLVDGEIAAAEADLELERETTYVAYLVGEPEPLDVSRKYLYQELTDSGVDEGKWILFQAYEVYPGTGTDDVVTEPSQPVSTTDQNRPIEFDCPPIELYETNTAAVELSATDPDGLVTGLAIESTDPSQDSIWMIDNSVDRAELHGEPTTARIRVGSDARPGTYDVTVVSNPESVGAEATCTFPVTIRKITIERLRDLVDRYEDSGDVEPRYATALRDHLDDAAAHLADVDTTAACTSLKQFLDLMGNYKDKGVSERALNDLQPEVKRLRAHVGCG